jgi:hypothetical protein
MRNMVLVDAIKLIRSTILQLQDKTIPH